MDKSNLSINVLNNDNTNQQKPNAKSHDNKPSISLLSDNKIIKQKTNRDKYAKLREINQAKSSASSKHESYFIRKFGRSHIYQKFKEYQKMLYLILEEPSSSYAGKILFVIIIICIGFTSIHAIIYSTEDDTQQPETDFDTLNILEFLISSFFVIEYFLRLFSCTAFGEEFLIFIRKPFMIIDFVSILPFLLDQVFGLRNFRLLKVVRLMRLIKVFRILKLARYLKGANIFWDGVKASITSFGFLLLSLIIGNILFAVAYYYAEYDTAAIQSGDTSVVVSIPDAMWWGLVTMTTVGYGDKYPHTHLGKIISSITALTGMFMIALPVAILGVNFQKVYEIKVEHEKIKRLKKSITKKNPGMTEDQKEITFMEERIYALGNGSSSIRELLTKSDELYKIVEKEIKMLYSALYAQEKRDKSLQVQENDALGNSGMKAKIKIMERLQRAKRKIKLMQLFRQPVNGGCTYTHLPEHGENGQSDPRSSLNRKDEGKNMLNIDAQSINHISNDIKENDNEKKMFLNSKNELKKSICNQTTSKKFDEDTEISPMVSKEGENNENNNCIKNNKGMLKEHQTQRQTNNNKKNNNKDNRIVIKSNSQDNENSFIKYKNENLNFLTNDMLNEFILCDSDEDIKPKTNQKLKGFLESTKKLFLSKNQIQNSNIIFRSHVEKSKPRIHKEQFFLNKNMNKKPEQFDFINLNSNTWKLAEKIFEKSCTITVNEVLDKDKDKDKRDPSKILLRKNNINNLLFLKNSSSILTIPDDNDEEKKNENNHYKIPIGGFPRRGPNLCKTIMKVKTRKILEENEDFMPNIGSSFHEHYEDYGSHNDLIYDSVIKDRGKHNNDHDELTNSANFGSFHSSPRYPSKIHPPQSRNTKFIKLKPS